MQVVYIFPGVLSSLHKPATTIMKRNDLLDDYDFGDERQDDDYAADQELSFNPDAEGVVVGKFYDQLEANVYAARLRSEGVRCYVANTVSHSMLPNTQSYVSLIVHADEQDAAREIITDLVAEQGLPPASSGSFWLENGLLLGILALIVLLLVVSAYYSFR